MKSRCYISVGKDLFEGLTVELEIPFVPRPGDMLAVTPEGDFFRVEEVFWACGRPDVVDVYLQELGGFGRKQLLAQGWKMKTGGRHEHVSAPTA